MTHRIGWILLLTQVGCFNNVGGPKKNCVPTFCQAQGKDCGALPDGCGGALQCGSCTAPDSCGGSGVSNVCGSANCTPETDAAFCARYGKDCDSFSQVDNCGKSRTASCGSCTSPATCGGGGTPNVCGSANCTHETDQAFCQRLGKNCDSVSSIDNCGSLRTANCGSCGSPQTCGGGGAPNVCGCSSPSCTGASALFVNGSRIHYRTVSTADGLQAYYGLYDTAQNTPCYAVETTDGQARCVPVSTASLGAYYSDSSCSTPVAFNCGSGPAPAFTLQYTGGSVTQVRVFPVAATYGGTIYVGNAQSCTATTRTAGYAYYSVGAELPPSTWVAINSLPPGQGPTPTSNDLYQDGTRVRLIRQSGEDGSAGVTGIFQDSQLSASCYFAAMGDGIRCRPNQMYPASEFGDSTCSTLILSLPSTMTAPPFAYSFDSNGCELAYYQTGLPYGGQTYVSSAGKCVAFTSPSYSYFSLSSLPISTFASGSSSDGASYAGFKSGSRIQLKTATTADGARAWMGLFDAQLNADCAVWLAADGVMRCLPLQAAYVVGNYFADSACSQPLAIGTGCGAPAFIADESSCSASYYQVGAAYSGTVYYQSTTQCVPLNISRSFYRVGGPVPVSTFAEATLSQ